MAGSASLRSPLRPDLRPVLPGPRATATMVGALAIPFWATWPAIAKASQGMPTFQLLAIAFLVATCLAWTRPRPPAGEAGTRRSGWLPVGMATVGLLGSNATLVAALLYIPPAQANLISYLWPVMVVGLAGALGLAAVGRWQVAGVVLGLGGAALVIGGGEVVPAWTGIGLAFLSAALWSAFCVFRLWEGGRAGDVLPRAFAASAVLALAAHLLFEPVALPPAGALGGALLAGLVPMGLGNIVWDHGLRRGDGRLLAVMAFATPLVSTVILVALGWAEPTVGLVLGGLAIVAGGLASARR